MKFAFTDEQRMLRDTSQAFLAAESDSSAVRAASTSDKTYDPELWQKFAKTCTGRESSPLNPVMGWSSAG